MLTELRISNFGVIEQLAVRFDSGFIVFTGEMRLILASSLRRASSPSFRMVLAPSGNGRAGRVLSRRREWLSRRRLRPPPPRLSGAAGADDLHERVLRNVVD